MVQTLVDQLRRRLTLAVPPRRIVSLCPSTTETLFALGAGDRVVGRTTYCRHPKEAIDTLPSIGGTKTVDEQRLRALKPDLILSVREENDEQQIEALSHDQPILILDPVDVASALNGIRLIGAALGREQDADALAEAIASAFRTLPRLDGYRAAYLIWRKPFMAAGAGTYINDVMAHLGLENAAPKTDRYPAVDAQALAANPPHFLFAASEPFPFADKHVSELQRLAPTAKIVLVDGEMFGWHGVRMLKAARYFEQHVPLWNSALEQTSGKEDGR